MNNDVAMMFHSEKNERLASDKLRRRYGDPWVSHSGNEVQIVDCQDLFEFTRYVNQPK